MAVFDTMIPGGGYSNRIRQLGCFAPGPKAGAFSEDIGDPLYGNSEAAQERKALLAAVHQLRLACRGLLQQLHHLQAKYSFCHILTAFMHSHRFDSQFCLVLCPWHHVKCVQSATGITHGKHRLSLLQAAVVVRCDRDMLSHMLLCEVCCAACNAASATLRPAAM